MDHGWFQWINRLLPQLKFGSLVVLSRNFDHPAAAKLLQTAIDALQFSGLTMYPLQESRHRSGAIFQHSAGSAKTTSMVPLSPTPALKHIGNTRAPCRGIVDKATACSAAHKRMIGKYLLEVFGGSGFLAKATNILGLRGYALDAKFGPGYDVTQPLALTESRHDVSAGTCVAGMFSSARQHTSCSASASIVNLLHRARMPWIVEHPCDSWLWDMPTIQTLAAQPRTAWALADFCVLGSPCRKRTLFLVGNVDSRDLHRIARKCAGTGGRCSVTGQKDVHPKASASRSKFSSSSDHARPPRLSFALAMVLTMNARRFQGTHPLR